MLNPHPLIRILVGAASLAVVLSAVGVMLFCALRGSFQPWSLYAFEGVSIVAAVFGILFALGRFHHAPALAMLCVAGPIAIGAALVYIGLQGNLELRGSASGWSLKPWFAGRLAAAAVLTLIGAALSLQRDRASYPVLVRGVVAALPVVVVAAAAFWIRRSGGLSSMPLWLEALLAAAGAIVAGVSIAASGHFLIRAFEIGADAGERTDTPATPSAKG